MAFKGQIIPLALLISLGVCLAEVTKQKEATKDKESRLFFTTTTGTSNAQTITLGTLATQSITVGLDAAILIGLALAGLTAAVIVLAILLGIESGDKKYESTGYTAPTSYATAPAYEESSYVVHRSLEEAAKKFE